MKVKEKRSSKYYQNNFFRLGTLEKRIKNGFFFFFFCATFGNLSKNFEARSYAHRSQTSHVCLPNTD